MENASALKSLVFTVCVSMEEICFKSDSTLKCLISFGSGCAFFIDVDVGNVGMNIY